MHKTRNSNVIPVNWDWELRLRNLTQYSSSNIANLYLSSRHLSACLVSCLLDLYQESEKYFYSCGAFPFPFSLSMLPTLGTPPSGREETSCLSLSVWILASLWRISLWGKFTIPTMLESESFKNKAHNNSFHQWWNSWVLRTAFTAVFALHFCQTLPEHSQTMCLF